MRIGDVIFIKPLFVGSEYYQCLACFVGSNASSSQSTDHTEMKGILSMVPDSLGLFRFYYKQSYMLPELYKRC